MGWDGEFEMSRSGPSRVFGGVHLNSFQVARLRPPRRLSVWPAWRSFYSEGCAEGFHVPLSSSWRVLILRCLPIRFSAVTVCSFQEPRSGRTRGFQVSRSVAPRGFSGVKVWYVQRAFPPRGCIWSFGGFSGGTVWSACRVCLFLLCVAGLLW